MMFNFYNNIPVAINFLLDIKKSLSFIIFCEKPHPWQMIYPEPATPMYEGMIYFHNYLLFFIVFIGLFVCLLLIRIMIKFNSTKNPIPFKFAHSSTLEIIWTIIPAIILILIAIPSFALLYSLDEVTDPAVTMKIVGYQWYWQYSCSDVLRQDNNKKAIPFKSYMIPDDILFQKPSSGVRILDAVPRLLLPTKTHVRLLITSADVIHSWAVPAFGIKVDACPGRLTEASLYIKRRGRFYGQCSEICGVHHGFMPISIQATRQINFRIHWLERLYPEGFADIKKQPMWIQKRFNKLY